MGQFSRMHAAGIVDDFTLAYVTAALWSSYDGGEDGEGDTPLDRDHGWQDIDPASLLAMSADCAQFQAEHGALINTANYLGRSELAEAIAGHDFWLTRNHHGAGFWDGDWREPASTTLTNAAHAYGECNLYIGDDGKIYLAKG